MSYYPLYYQIDSGLNLAKAPVIMTSASGSVASFPDGAEDLPVQSLQVAINPVQDLHGYDNPWPAGGGKNLLTVPDADFTLNGIHYVSKDGIITLNGTSTGETSSANEAFRDNFSFTLPAGTYYFDRKTFTTPTYFCRGLDSDSILATNAGSFTLTESLTVWVAFYVENRTYNNEVLTLQLEVGSTGTAFSPVSNICPISGRTGVNVTRTGKNLFDFESTYYYNNNIFLGGFQQDNVVIVDGTFVLKAGTYTASVNTNLTAWYLYDESGQIGVRYNSAVYTFTLSEEKAICLRCYKVDTPTKDVFAQYDVQLELGSTATAYEPYQGETYPITFPQSAGTVYGGELTINQDGSGELVVDRANVDLGTMTWSAVTPTGRFTAELPSNCVPAASGGAIPNMKCSIYEVTTPNNVYSGNKDKAISSYNATLVQVYDSTYSTAEAIETALSGQQLVYELATPITYTLTAPQVRTLLGINNIWADTGDITATYRADTKLYIEQLTKPDEYDMIADANIASGKFFMVGNRLFLSTAAIEQGAAIVPGTNCTEMSLADALNILNT